MGRCLRWLARHKDGLTVLLALVFIPVGLFQYLDYRASERIKAAVSMLERRETAEIVSADTDLRRFWQDAFDNAPVIETEDSYAEFMASITPAILADNSYRRSVIQLSSYYNSVASCAIGDVCDRAVVCSSLAGDIQEFLGKNRWYFAYLWSQSPIEAKRHFLSLPEFVELCIGEGDDGKTSTRNALWPKSDLYLYGIHDQRLPCQFGLWLERFFSLGASVFCGAGETAYDRNVEALLKRSSAEASE